MGLGPGPQLNFDDPLTQKATVGAHHTGLSLGPYKSISDGRLKQNAMVEGRHTGQGPGPHSSISMNASHKRQISRCVIRALAPQLNFDEHLTQNTNFEVCHTGMGLGSKAQF